MSSCFSQAHFIKVVALPVISDISAIPQVPELQHRQNERLAILLSFFTWIYFRVEAQ